MNFHTRHRRDQRALRETGPGSYHNGAGNLSFADGHAESHKWVDARTRPPLVRDHDLPLDVFMVNCISSPGNWDVQWLQARAYQKGD